MSKKMTVETFNQVRAMQEDRVPTKWIAKTTGFSPTTITMANKFDTKEAMDKYNRDRLAGYRKPKQLSLEQQREVAEKLEARTGKSIEDITTEEVNAKQGFTPAMEYLSNDVLKLLNEIDNINHRLDVIAQRQLEQLEGMTAIVEIQNDIAKTVTKNTKKGWIK